MRLHYKNANFNPTLVQLELTSSGGSVNLYYDFNPTLVQLE